LVAVANKASVGKGVALPFDFRRPSKFSRDHVRALQIVHETFARHFSTVLATTLRAIGQVSLTSVQPLTYDEYVRSLPNPSYLVIMSLHPLPGAAMFQFPLEIAFAAVDRLLGGNGDSPSPERALTEIEANLMRSLVDRALRELEYAYESIMKVEAEIIQHEFNPQFAQIAAPSDMVLAATFEIRIGEKRGSSTICVPHNMLELVLETIASQQLFSDRAHVLSEQWTHTLQDAIENVPVDVSVVFDSVSLTSNEVVGLRVGDIVPLEHSVDAPLTVEVDGIPCYHAVTGRRSKRLACLIVGNHTERVR
jgi:flagellar motor switch protein FliM